MPRPVVRPLPELTDDNRFFWTSGEDGILRFQRCAACHDLRHPPSPVCPSCGSTEWAPSAVSGRGVVAGYTVNEHTWLPSFPPPYVVAIVALDEDDRVRLTTNIIGCDPGDVSVGMRVQVVFERQDDVWLPLFEPTGETEPGPLPTEDPRAHQARPMPRAGDKFEDRVAITGIGTSRVGRRLMQHPLALAVAASRAAIADAGLQPDDIDGLCTYPGSGIGHGMSEGGVTALEEMLRLRPSWINSGMETPGQTGSVIAAMLAVAGGLCKHVLCFRTVWEATLAAQTRMAPTSAAGPATRVAGDMQWRFPFGATSAANWIAMNASQHFHRYGTTRETLGWLALNARANAALNPAAIYRDPLTMDDYLSARMITWPFGLYDCDVPIDGSVAIIVSRKDVASDLAQPPVYVEAVGTQVTERMSWDQGVLEHEPLTSGPGAHLWTRTDLGPSDVDVAELYDGFSFLTMCWLEAMGFCGRGESGPFIEGGSRIALEGELPINTNGGQLSAGRLHGFGFVHEACVQLRGEGGERQVPKDVHVVAVGNGGGPVAGCMLLTRD